MLADSDTFGTSPQHADGGTAVARGVLRRPRRHRGHRGGAHGVVLLTTDLVDSSLRTR